MTPRLSLLLSQPPQKASGTICKQVTSILIVTSHMNLEQQLRIFGHLIWTENCLWRVTLPIRIIYSHCHFRPPHCWILPHILHPPIPRLLHLWHFTIRLCSQTLKLWKVKKFKAEASATEGRLASPKTHLKRGSWRGVWWTQTNNSLKHRNLQCRVNQEIGQAVSSILCYDC